MEKVLFLCQCSDFSFLPPTEETGEVAEAIALPVSGCNPMPLTISETTMPLIISTAPLSPDIGESLGMPGLVDNPYIEPEALANFVSERGVEQARFMTPCEQETDFDETSPEVYYSELPLSESSKGNKRNKNKNEMPSDSLAYKKQIEEAIETMQGITQIMEASGTSIDNEPANLLILAGGSVGSKGFAQMTGMLVAMYKTQVDQNGLLLDTIQRHQATIESQQNMIVETTKVMKLCQTTMDSLSAEIVYLGDKVEQMQSDIALK